ncbi:MAG: hydrogenase maturation nickel metallochaperone HypA [Methanomassiliicoccales archaeon]|nr:hydrogenase maturation nickel metallochaperone HypA [Methanomassiliicoccales archaeon]
MHEVSVMSDIINAVLGQLGHYEIEKVEEVVLVVGELTFLGEEQLRFAFEILSKGTILEGAELIIETEKAILRCPSCGFEGPPEHIGDGTFHFSIPILSCPKCGNQADIIKGKCCGVTSVKVVEK